MNKWKHFLIFSIISFVITFLINLIGMNANPSDILMLILNFISIFTIPILITVLIRTYKSEKSLSIRQKLLFLAGIVLVLFLSTLLINIINPFGRKIFLEDIYSGAKLTLTVYVIMFVLSLPIVIFVKSKLLTDK